MTDTELLDRIVLNPEIMVGKPVIRGTRLTVDHVLNRLAHGERAEDILDEYSNITVDDINACLLFACVSLRDVTYMPLSEVA